MRAIIFAVLLTMVGTSIAALIIWLSNDCWDSVYSIVVRCFCLTPACLLQDRAVWRRRAFYLTAALWFASAVWLPIRYALSLPESRAEDDWLFTMFREIVIGIVLVLVPLIGLMLGQGIRRLFCRAKM